MTILLVFLFIKAPQKLKELFEIILCLQFDIKIKSKYAFFPLFQSTITLGFINDNHFIDFLYFSIVTQSLLGYGDIIPATRIMRGVVSIQVIISLIILLSTGSAMLTKLLK